MSQFAATWKLTSVPIDEWAVGTLVSLSLFTFPSDILPPGPRSMSGEQLTGGPRKTKMGCGQNTEECRRPKLKATARNSGKDSTR